MSCSFVRSRGSRSFPSSASCPSRTTPACSAPPGRSSSCSPASPSTAPRSLGNWPTSRPSTHRLTTSCRGETMMELLEVQTPELCVGSGARPVNWAVTGTSRVCSAPALGRQERRSYSSSNVSLTSPQTRPSGVVHAVADQWVNITPVLVFTGLYWSLPVSTGLYWSLPTSTSLYQSLLASTVLYQPLPVSTGLFSTGL